MSDLGVCGWCDEPAVTHVITKPGRKNRRTAPVCETHAKDFESRGQLTVRLEVERDTVRESERRQWLKKNRGWR